VRVGDEPDKRLLKFLCEDLPDLKEEAKPEFLRFKDVHAAYGSGKMPYKEWLREIMVRSGIWSEGFEGEDDRLM